MIGVRIAGIDVGDKRIGVAVSDGLGLTAQPIAVVQRSSLKQDVAKVLEHLAGYQVTRVVAGLPLEMSGREGTQAQCVRSFCDALANAGVEVVFQDERMTTVQSERLLIESGVRRNKRREVIDKMAAALILQAYLDAQPRGQDA